MKRAFFSFLLILTGIIASACFMFSNKSVPTTDTPEVLSTAQTGFAVAELFTSQGCSSCPPADNLLREMAAQKGVFPLSFHVTYWNRLGWRDTFSQAVFDERQYHYGKRFRLSSVYTPQLIINGSSELVGSRASQVKSSLQQALAQSSAYTIELEKEMEDNTLKIKYRINPMATKLDLNLAVVESGIVTHVKRGENGGKTLRHDNVVRYFTTTPLNNVRAGNIRLPQSYFNHTMVVYLQEPNLGSIVAAIKLE